MATKKNLKIVIAQRGWVYIGEHSKDGAYEVLTNAKVIRRWGTTKGIGQLALEGPTENTKLDETGTIRVHELATVAILDVATPAKW